MRSDNVGGGKDLNCWNIYFEEVTLIIIQLISFVRLHTIGTFGPVKEITHVSLQE